MFRPLEVAIGLRYTRAKRRSYFISFISLTSIAGIMLGVWALITVMSVMNGFEKELKERILGMASHATIAAADGALRDWSRAAATAQHHPEVQGVAPYVEGQGMLTHGGLVHAALIRGVLPESEPAVSDIDRFMQAGRFEDLEDGAYRVLIGRALARSLGAQVGDKITLVAPQATVTPAGIIPRMRRFTVAGIFEVGYQLADSGLAVVHLRDAARLLRLGNSISGLRIKLDDLDNARRVSHALARSLGGRYWVRDWTQHHVNFFRALKTEKVVMFIILTFIVAVAAFNIISALVMVVTDKQADIAILRTLGASPGSIMAMFIVQGTIIGFFGVLGGAALGVLTAANVETIVPAIEHFFETKFLPEDVYYISEVPSDMRWPDVVWITVVAFIMSVVATLYPAWRAAKTQPAEALRYE